jgi:prevent-host-death family protein
MTIWQLQEAKARLSELVKRAASEGPQQITVHGVPAAVLVSAEEFARMKLAKGEEPSFWEILRRAPLAGEDLVIERDPDTRFRDVQF